jgi:hypothetical protein
MYGGVDISLKSGIHGQGNSKKNTHTHATRSFMILVLVHYCSGDQIKKNETDTHVAQIVEKRDVYRVLVGKTGGWGGQNHLYMFYYHIRVYMYMLIKQAVCGKDNKKSYSY